MSVHTLNHVRMKCVAEGIEIKSLIPVYERNLRMGCDDPVVAHLSGDLRAIQIRRTGSWIAPVEMRKSIPARHCYRRLWRKVLRNIRHAHVQNARSQS